MKIYEALLLAQNPEKNIRDKAETFLKDFEHKNFEGFFINLSIILEGEIYNPHIRRLAGIILKNKLEIKREIEKKIIQYNWFASISKITRNQIKKSIINVLKSYSIIARKTASQVLAKIICIELSNKEENNLIYDFLNYLENNMKDAVICHSILETIQYMCQEVGSRAFKEKTFHKHSFQILRILLLSINEGNENFDLIKIAALHAFLPIVEFIENIFNTQIYRDFIINSICNQFESKNVYIKAISFEILEKFAKNYYFWLDDYIYFLFKQSLLMFQNDNDLIILQITEFWITIAHQEFEIKMNEYQALNEGKVYAYVSKNYILKTSSHISNLLLGCIEIKKNEECVEEWNCRNAAGACLNIMNQICPREIIHSVILYIDKSFCNNNEINVENISLAFISILDGIGLKIMYIYARKIMNLFIIYIEKNNFIVNDILNLVIGKIIKNFSCTVRYILNKIMHYLLYSLTNRQVSCQRFWCLKKILNSFGQEGIIDWCFEGIYLVILKQIFYNSNYTKTIGEFFEIISSIIINSSIRNISYIFLILPYILFNLKISFNYKENKQHFDIREIQSYLCRIISCVIQKYGKKIKATFLKEVIKVFHLIYSDNETISRSFLEEEILACIGALIQTNKIRKFFTIRNWINFIFNCIERNKNEEICRLAIGIIGDICRTMPKEIKPFIEKILNVLTLKLKKNISMRNKSIIITCVGDISLSHGCSIKNYPTIFESIKQTIYFLKKLSKKTEIESIELSIEIKEWILEGITGIIQGIQDQNNNYDKSKLNEKFELILNFIFECMCSDRTLRLVKICIGILLDLSIASVITKSEIKKQVWIFQLLKESKDNKQSKNKHIEKWAFDIIYDKKH